MEIRPLDESSIFQKLLKYRFTNADKGEEWEKMMECLAGMIREEKRREKRLGWR